MADEALTVKGQSLFLFLKSTHLSFRFVFSIMSYQRHRKVKMKERGTKHRKISSDERKISFFAGG